jgi:hypothetical protein
MTRENAPSSFLAPNWLTLILGAWLFISPWVLQSAGMGNFAWDAWVLGVLMVALSIGALYQLTEWEDWGNLVLAVLLFISPWVLGFSGSAAPAWDAWIVGVITAVISIWGIVAIRQDGPGHLTHA